VIRRATELARSRWRSIGAVLARSGAYRPMIHRELQRQGVPIELASVPVIESGYVPNALGRWVAGSGSLRRIRRGRTVSLSTSGSISGRTRSAPPGRRRATSATSTSASGAGIWPSRATTRVRLGSSKRSAGAPAPTSSSCPRAASSPRSRVVTSPTSWRRP
jgi:hypothetical protein